MLVGRKRDATIRIIDLLINGSRVHDDGESMKKTSSGWSYTYFFPQLASQTLKLVLRKISLGNTKAPDCERKERKKRKKKWHGRLVKTGAARENQSRLSFVEAVRRHLPEKGKNHLEDDDDEEDDEEEEK